MENQNRDIQRVKVPVRKSFHVIIINNDYLLSNQKYSQPILIRLALSVENPMNHRS